MENEKKKLFQSALFPALFILLLAIIHFIENHLGFPLTQYGITPLSPHGLIGIFAAPLLHADFAHLMANSVPLFILGTALFYFYKDTAVRVILYSWIIAGGWTWLFARGSGVHIGASGLVYALAAFHFVSGIIRKHKGLSAFSLFVVFIYGSMIWGIFPDFFPKKNISWESHLMGGIIGLILAFFYREKGPQKREYLWEDEEEEDDDENAYWKVNTPPAGPKVKIKYEIKPKKEAPPSTS